MSEMLTELQLRHQQIQNKQNLDKPGQRTQITKFKWGVNAPKSILDDEAFTFTLSCRNETKHTPHDFPVNDMEAIMWKVGENDKTTKGTIKRLKEGEYQCDWPTPAAGNYAVNIQITDPMGTRFIYKDHNVLKIQVVNEEKQQLKHQINFEIIGKNLSTARVNMPFKFEVQSKDSSNQPFNVKLGEFVVTFKIGNTVKEATISQKQGLTGAYNVELTPHAATANCIITVSYLGKEAKSFGISCQ